MTIREALEAAADRAAKAGADATVWDARLLLAHAMGGAPPLGLDPRITLDPVVAARFEALWEKRLTGVPVQHLIGEWDFYGRPFRVDGRALVPRPETEILVEQALKEAAGARRVLDAGTGSGIIAITYLLERPEATAVALDISIDALALAHQNAERHGVRPRLTLLASDWLTGAGRGAFRPRPLQPALSRGRRVAAICLRPCAITIPGEPCSPGTTGWWRSATCWRPCRPSSSRAASWSSRSGSASPRPCARRSWPARSGVSSAMEPDLEGIPRICVARLESASERVSRIRKPWTSS